MKNKLLIIAALGLLAVLVVGRANAQTSGNASLALSPTTGTYETGDQFDATVTFNAGGHEVDAVDVVLDYDPTALAVASIQTGNLFPTYPVSTSSDGTIRISGLASITDPVTSAGTMATITFTVIGASNNSPVAFVYGSDTGSLVAEHGTAQNVLGSRTDAGFVLQAAAPTPTSAPTATPTPLVEALPNSGIAWPTYMLVLLLGVFMVAGTLILL